MKHKTWFRLVIKAIGVLLVGLSVPNLISSIVAIIDAVIGAQSWTFYTPYSTTGVSPGDLVMGAVLQILPASAQTCFGLYLLLGGKWLVNKCIPSNRPYCPECGYDLSNASGDKCPECGIALPQTANTNEGSLQ
jgi:hypothetical protein